MNTLSTARIVARKDLRLYFRDRTGMVLGFLLPVVLITVFGFIMKYAFRGEGMAKATLWVADQDDGRRSRQLIEELSNSETVRVKRPDKPAADDAEMRSMITEGEAHHVLVIRPGFGEAIAAGNLPKLIMLRDPGRKQDDRLIQIGLIQAFMAVSEGKLWPAAMANLMREAGMEEAQVRSLIAATKVVNRLVSDFITEKASEDQRRKDRTDPGGDGRSHGPAAAGAPIPQNDPLAFDLDAIVRNIVPIENEDLPPPGRPKQLSYMLAQSVAGTTVMMLMFGVLGCSTMLLFEREGGTLPRLLVAAMPRAGIYWGKFLFTWLIGIVQLAVLFTYGNLLFEIKAFRDPITLLVLSITWAAAATSFGMLIAAWAGTAKQAEGLATILILVMAAGGGCWFPIQMMDLPRSAEIATRCSLAYWAMEGYQGMFWHQLPWTDAKMLTAVAVQWAFVVLGAIAALILYQRRYVPG